MIPHSKWTPDEFLLEYQRRIATLPARFHKPILENMRFEEQGFFVNVTANDKADYHAWAREHFNSDVEMKSVWHPEVILECIKILREEAEPKIEE